MSASGRRIGFVLCSDASAPLPSTRISVFNVLPALRAAGYDPRIAFAPPQPTERPDVSGLAARLIADGIDIAYFQKVHGPGVRAEIETLRQAGVRTVYGVCDRIDDDMVRLTDATVIVTDYLKQQHAPELQARIHVVHDGIEHPEVRCREDIAAGDGRLRAILVTSGSPETVPVLGRPPRWLALTVVGQYPERETPLQALRARLRRVRHAPPGERLERLRGYAFTARAWQPQRVYEDLAGAEIGIIPVDMRPDPLPGRQVSYWQVKSENRLTLKMAAGLAVVASPVPSYLDIIEQGVNGYIAHSRADWLAALDALRDPQHRQSVGAAARASVLQRYSIDEQARRLIAVFDGLRGTSQPAGDAALLRMP